MKRPQSRGLCDAHRLQPPALFRLSLCLAAILLAAHASLSFSQRRCAAAGAGGGAAKARAPRRPCPSCPAPVPVFGSREDLGALLELEFPGGAGVELGVQRGEFAAATLRGWPNCSRFVLVDVWAHLPNYEDLANLDDTAQDGIMHRALEAVAPWRDRVVICRNLTTHCASRFPDASFDFVYVDARHDRVGVTEDLEMWWPKARRGALFCGHDFVTQQEGPAQSGQRWDVNADGSVDPTGRAVRGAVEDFAARKARQIQVSYKESYYWTWCMRR